METFRLDHALPTLKYLIQNQSKVIIAGHMGRPEGSFDSALSTKQLLPYFNEKLGEGIEFKRLPKKDDFMDQVKTALSL